MVLLFFGFFVVVIFPSFVAKQLGSCLGPFCGTFLWVYFVIFVRGSIVETADVWISISNAPNSHDILNVRSKKRE